MKKILLILFLLICELINSQSKQIETSDIKNFWEAYDKLQYALNKTDSLSIIQVDYIDKATDFFKEFIKIRNFTAEEYLYLIAKYPKFWKSIRKDTENVQNRGDEIEKIFDKYETTIPNFKRPNVCFAIGCLRTGGTISNNLILIGTEIAASTPETDQSELSPWLKSVMGTYGYLATLVSHETIHTQQKGNIRNLAEYAISEGVADFLSEKVSGFIVNKNAFSYGLKNDCELRKEFLNDYAKNKYNISKWLYNGSKSKSRPADLGYYIGYKIAEEYYNSTNNREDAILTLLNRKKYKKIFKKSAYIRTDCS